MKKKFIINNSLRVAILLALTAPVVQATDFYFGEDNEILLAINSQLSIGSSWRMTERNPRFYSSNNLADGIPGTGLSSTTDDDTLNFGKHDAFSTIIKGNNDFQLEKDGFGAFVRVKYWYDMELKDGDRPHGNGPNGYAAGQPLSDDGFTDTAKFSGIQLLDAYVYGSFDIADMPLDVRLGRQVLSWGESTFIQGGINGINPLDVSALRRPGAKLKEGLLPVGMLSANIGVSEDLSIEAFYQYEWEKTQIDGCGTFFATVDYAADGCNYITVGLDDATALQGGVYSKRVNYDIEPDDGGQYGLALRYYSEALHDTEFGFYYTNLHSRLPIVSVYRQEWSDYGPNENTPPVDLVDITGSTFLPWAATADPATAGLLNAYGITDLSKNNIDSINSEHVVEFVEDLKTYGVSFATNVSGVALSGEVSYHEDVPTQINGPHAVGASVIENPNMAFTKRLQAVEGGEYVAAWDAFDITQLQITAIQFFDQVLGASKITFIGEVALTLTDGIEDMGKQGFHYGRDDIYSHNDYATPTVTRGGTLTDSAWGYRTRVEFDYPDLFAGIALKPVISWYHDVDGYSAQFNEGSTVSSVSLEALYQQKYSLTVSYTNFGGGEFNSNTDKDFLAVSFALSY